MQKIVIKNFRQIKHAEVEVKNLLLLVGEQASGKSTIAKLIYFFKSLKEEYISIFEIYLVEEIWDTYQMYATFRHETQKKFWAYFGDARELDDDFEIIFYFNVDKQYSIKIKKDTLGGDLFTQIVIEKSFAINIIKNILDLSPNASETKKLSKEMNLSFMHSMQIIERVRRERIASTNELFNDNFIPKFIPAGRHVSTFFSEHTRTLIQNNLAVENAKNKEKSIDSIFLQEFLNHVAFLRSYFERKKLDNSPILDFFANLSNYILKGEYKQENQSEVINSNGVATLLAMASSGQQEAIRIVQDLLYLLIENQTSFRVIEEPEAHLYPKAQKYLLELMALIINLTGSQIIITSHSPYVLSIVNNLLLYTQTLEKNPASRSTIEEHFGTKNLDASKKQQINLNSEQVQAYLLSLSAEDYCVSAMDKETGLIGDNFLDQETEALNNDFQTLYHLYFQN